MPPANCMPVPDVDRADSDSASEYVGSDAADELEDQGKSKSKHTADANAKHTIIKKGGNDNDGGGPVVRAMKKISASAHTNFRRLKLRNTGAKGGKTGGRFRRGRR
jgi:hypothetical protein